MGMDLYKYRVTKLDVNEKRDEWDKPMVYVGENLTESQKVGLKSLYTEFYEEEIKFEPNDEKIDALLKSTFGLTLEDLKSLDETIYIYDVWVNQSSKYVLKLKEIYIQEFKMLQGLDNKGDKEAAKKLEDYQLQIETAISEVPQTTLMNEILSIEFGELLLVGVNNCDRVEEVKLNGVETEEIGYMRKPFRHRDLEGKVPSNVVLIGNFSGVNCESIVEVFKDKAIFDDNASVFIDYHHRDAIDELLKFVPEEEREKFYSMKPETENEVVCIDW